MRSSMIHVPGPVHIADWGHGSTRFVLVHGLGGCHLNWMAVAPELARHGRVIAPDLAGFGKTPVAGRQTNIDANQELLHRVLVAIAGEPVVLVGNSMGGLIAMMEASRNPETVRGLILVNPALPSPLTARIDPLVLAAFASWLVPHLVIGPLQRLRGGATHDERVRGILAFCAADWRSIPTEVVEAHIRLSRARGATAEFDRTVVSAARSIQSAYMNGRAIRQMLREITAPTLLIHGDRDRIVNVSASRQAAAVRPDWNLKILKGVGHIPQMESPALFMTVVERWLARHHQPHAEHIGRKPVAAHIGAWVATRTIGAPKRPRSVPSPLAG